MKKFLSLALALVMTMSLVTISASADFADDSAITYAEAVDVMAELDVIGGYADGSFAPTGTLTRGAAAKIICNMILGPTTAEALGADTAPFPDVPADHTFAGYIAYCAQQGILSGYADGNFYPAGQVTAVQFMKMLLGALGYSSDIEGFTGANWSINVQKLALSLGLDDGNEDYVGTAAMTREEACLYAFNTLQATMVEYPNNTSLVVGDIAISTSSNASKVETSDAKAGYDGEKDGYVQFCEEYFSNLSSDESFNAFGQPVTTWKIKSSSIGTYINNDELVAEYEGKVTHATMYDLIDKDDDYVEIYVDGTDDVFNYGYDLFTKNSSSAAAGSGNGSVTYVYEIDDNDFVIVTKNTYLVQAADDYDADDEYLKISELDDMNYAYTTADSETSNNINVSIQKYIENDDVNVEDFEDGDYILVTIANDDIKSAVLAESVTGTVTTYTDNSSVTIDGEKYSYSSKFNNKDQQFAINEDTVAVLDEQGKIIYIDDLVVNSDRYVFVKEFDSSSSFSSDTFYAAAYFADGTYAEIEIDEIYGEDVINEGEKDSGGNNTCSSKAGLLILEDDTLVNAGTWFTYTTNSNGSYDLTMVEDDYTVNEAGKVATQTDIFTASSDSISVDVISSGSVTFATGRNAEDNANVSAKGNSNTVFVLYDGDDVYSYTGISNVPDVVLKSTASAGTDTAAVYALMDGTYAAFVFIDASEADVDGAAAATYNYMFALKKEKTTTDANNDVVYDYEALIDGEIVDVTVTSDVNKAGSMAGYLYYDVDEGDDGYIKSADKFVDQYTVAAGLDTKEDAYSFSYTDGVASQSGDVLTIADSLTNTMDFYMGSDSVAYVIVTDDAPALMNDTGLDYEVTEYSTAKSLYNDLKGYKFDAEVSMVADDEGSETVVALYIYITAAEEVEEVVEVYSDIEAVDGLKFSTNGSNWVDSIDNVKSGTPIHVYYNTSYGMLDSDTLELADNGSTSGTKSGKYIFDMPEADVTEDDFIKSVVYASMSVALAPTTTGGEVKATVTVGTNGAVRDDYTVELYLGEGFVAEKDYDAGNEYTFEGLESGSANYQVKLMVDDESICESRLTSVNVAAYSA